MPIYEFRCEGCGEVFELLAMSKNDQVEAKCPHCDSVEISRVLSSCASVVSGSSASPQSADQPGVQSRSCANAGNCSTVTLPGHTR